MKKSAPLAAIVAAATHTAIAADLYEPTREPGPPVVSAEPIYPVYRGRVSVMDGRTLWYPQYGQRVRLGDIDACELSQWALNPKWENREQIKAPAPVPCGPLSKAWLNRSVGRKPVECTTLAYAADGVPLARCTAGGRDLALEMLRVGWARVATPYPSNGQYLVYQRYAMAARYGMWATYVLDMPEWRAKAIDRTLVRRPIADFNLLAERVSEISPPFEDARKRPRRTDR